MADLKYKKATVIGNGKLACDCAVILKSFIDDVSIVEYMLSDSSSLERLALKNGIVYSRYDKDALTAFFMNISENTLIVSAGNTYLFPEKVIAKENLLIVNWHNALLPKHKGRNAECWAIYSGDKESGITWHMLTKDVDGGDVIIQKVIPIEDCDTAISLFEKQYDAGRETFNDIAENLLKGSFETVSQTGSGELHYSKDVPAGGYLDMSLDLEHISAFLRSMDYGALMLMGPYHVVIDGDDYSFSKYRITDEPSCTGFSEKGYCFEKEGKYIILRKLERTEK